MRRLFNFSAALSIVLFSATLVGWLLSLRWCDDVGWVEIASDQPDKAHVILYVSAARGLVTLVHDPATTGVAWARTSHRIQWTHGSEQPWLAQWRWTRMGFYYSDELSVKYASIPMTIVIIPMYALLAVFSVLPFLRVAAQIRRRRRAARGECGNCGYNLTGNTSGVCPECGKPIPQPLPARHRDG